MFVAIDNQNMDVFEVENWINVNRNANGGVISPEFAMEILGKTNHFAQIKKVVNHIKKSCMDENGELVKDKVLAYKEFILSSVDGRGQEGVAFKWLQELADACGIREEFDVANGKEPKEYDKNECDRVVVKSKGEFEALKGNNLKVFIDANYINLVGCYLGEVKSLKFKKGAEVDLSGAINLPKDLDVSMCSEVKLTGCDLEGLDLKFREGAEVNLNNAEKLPKDLDVSMCSKVELIGCDLEGLELKFREGAEVYLSAAENLPKKLDLSMCSKVDLIECNVEGLELKFREGAEVDLGGAKNLPKYLDLSMCSKVTLSECNLSGVESIKFREGAVVDLKGAMNLPKELDFSMCSKVDLSGCNLEGVEKITFKNGYQKDKSMKFACNFSGKVKYESLFNKIGKVLNKEM